MLSLRFWPEGSSTTKRGLFALLPPPVSRLGPRRTSKTATKTIFLHASCFSSAAMVLVITLYRHAIRDLTTPLVAISGLRDKTSHCRFQTRFPRHARRAERNRPLVFSRLCRRPHAPDIVAAATVLALLSLHLRVSSLACSFEIPCASRRGVRHARRSAMPEVDLSSC